jgi:hypothetical protein
MDKLWAHAEANGYKGGAHYEIDKIRERKSTFSKRSRTMIDLYVDISSKKFGALRPPRPPSFFSFGSQAWYL